MNPSQPSGPCPTGSEFVTFMVTAVPLLERLALRMTPNRADAMDLVQATCQRALEKRDRFTSGSFYHVTRWLVTIMRNLHRDMLRKWQHEQLTPSLDDLPGAVIDPPALAPLWTAIGDDQIARAVSALTPHLRQAYTLFAVKRLSYAKIAALLHIRPATVATRVFRARGRLRALLSGERPSRPDWRGRSPTRPRETPAMREAGGRAGWAAGAAPSDPQAWGTLRRARRLGQPRAGAKPAQRQILVSEDRERRPA